MQTWRHFDSVHRFLADLTRPLRLFARSKWKDLVLYGSIGFIRLTHRAPGPILRRMRWAWDEGEWSAGTEYIQAVLAEVDRNKTPVIEIGSGLTTVVLAALGVEVVSLEHLPEYAQRLRAFIRWSPNARLIVRPLVPYGEYSWYHLDDGDLPQGSRLIVCDGPPGATPGGRYGLLPVAKPAKRTVILLDDAARPGEQEVLARWRDEGKVTFEVVHAQRPYALVLVI